MPQNVNGERKADRSARRNADVPENLLFQDNVLYGACVLREFHHCILFRGIQFNQYLPSGNVSEQTFAPLVRLYG